MKRQLMPQLARLISSNTLLKLKRSFTELKRGVTQQPYTMDVFLQINDPYSYLLVQTLPDIAERYNVNLRLRTIYQVNLEMFPEQEMWENNAFSDALRLASLYGLAMPKLPPKKTEPRIQHYTNQLVNNETSCNSLDMFKRIFDNYWHQDDLEQPNISTAGSPSNNTIIKHNEALLQRLGHYMAAMIYFGGEWYWGVDRLDHFEIRANELGLAKYESSVVYDRTYADFCKGPEVLPSSARLDANTLTLFFSIRSPYSHIGLERAVVLAEHYKVELVVKPVLPMIMRGLSVPNSKKMYIFHDTKREAQKYGINYGYVADPLGAGVERCYALFEYAASQGKSIEYLLAYARAVNAEGIRSETDRGLKKILLSCGLDWQTAKPLLKNKSWNIWADKHLQEMYSYGLWGVPSFKYKNTTAWGQDRIFVIENELINELS